MRYIFTIFIAFLSLTTNAQAAEDIKGHWLTENKRAVVKIDDCAKNICGSIYWIIEGGMQFDGKNPAPELRSQPLCGLNILKNFKKTDANEWGNGTIYKADDGDTYKATLTLQSDDTLKVRGYIGLPMLGKSQIWERVEEEGGYETCEAP